MIGGEAGKMALYQATQDNTKELLAEWVKEQMSTISKQGAIKEADLRDQCDTFLHLFTSAIRDGNTTDLRTSEWDAVLRYLNEISATRSEQGFSPSETATFIFSFKKPLFTALGTTYASDAPALASATWESTAILDRLGLYTMDVFLKTRETIIARQQEDMMELSTPVVSLAEGILALPVIGTLDSARTQVVMESLLQRIVDTGSTVAIIDITGVPTVDTLVAQHLLKTVTAARLMGADCIISGIRPQIAQTIVHLGVDLGDVITKATLSSAFAVALQRKGMTISRIKAQA